jgi:antitoxin PrlF
MTVDRKEGACCTTEGASCQVEAVLTVDERGQMILPKEIRDRAGIHAGDKLALVSWEKDDRICCFALLKTEEFGIMVKTIMEPLIGGISKGVKINE